METVVTDSAQQAPTASAHRFKWFAGLSMAAVAIIAIPTLAFQVPVLATQGFSNPFGGALAFIYLPVSFAVWQASLVLLYLSGRNAVKQNLTTAITLPVCYIVTAAVAIALFWIFPAQFY